VFVVSTGAGGSVVLRVNGREVTARSSVPLRANQWYFVRIERAGGNLTLRLDSQAPRGLVMAELAREAGLPPGVLAEAVVRAFVRSELPLVPTRLSSAYRRLAKLAKGSGRSARELARIDAIAQRKGLVLSDETVAEIAGYAGGQDLSHSQAGEREGGSGAGHQDPVEALERAVRSSIRLSETADHPIQLFNHVVGEGDHWVIVPIDTPGVNLRSTLRLLIARAFATGHDRQTGAVRDAVLSVERSEGNEEGQWLFRLKPAQGGLKVEFVSGPAHPGIQAEVDRLARHLEPSGIHLRTQGGGEREADGFSQRFGGDIMKSVDSSA
jgi:hypothetical protein